MIIMPVPKDIRDFKPKFIGPLTKPQFLGVLVAGLLAALAYALLGSVLDSNILMAIIFVLAAPPMACGFIQVRQLPLPIYIRDVMARNLLAPAKRPYKTDNSYQKLGEQMLITYEYFDPDFGYSLNKNGEKVKEKKRAKLAKAKLDAYLAQHPDMKGME